MSVHLIVNLKLCQQLWSVEEQFGCKVCYIFRKLFVLEKNEASVTLEHAAYTY